MRQAPHRAGLVHSLMRAYLKGPDHPAKLRIYDWLRLMPLLRHPTVSTGWGVVRLDLADYLQHQIFLNLCYEPLTFALFNRLLQSGSHVIDVGANIGQYALSASRLVGPDGRVIAVEPNPQICQKLIDHRRLNGFQGRMEIVSAAIGTGDRLLDFGVPPATNLGTTRPRTDAAQESFWTPAVSLSRLVEAFGLSEIDVVKIDVEGHDLDVVRSLIESSSVRPRHIIFEYIPDAFHYDIQDRYLAEYFDDQGYDLRLVTGDEYIHGCDIIEFNIWAKARQPRGSDGLSHNAERR